MPQVTPNHLQIEVNNHQKKKNLKEARHHIQNQNKITKPIRHNTLMFLPPFLYSMPYCKKNISNSVHIIHHHQSLDNYPCLVSECHLRNLFTANHSVVRRTVPWVICDELHP